jgi:uncharacterized membrane protein YtjA (UPF0391 family)
MRGRPDVTPNDRRADSAPTCRPPAGLRPANPDFVPRRTKIFRVSELETAGNIRSRARLIQQPMRGAVSRADVEQKTKVSVMLSWVVTFLVIALIAGILGFGGVAGVSIEIAKTIFFIAVVLFLISAVIGLARGRTNV